MKRTVIYCRVSTEEQVRSGLSLDTQENVCREDATKMGYEVVDVIMDEGVSAGSLNRSGIRKLKEIAEKGLIDAVHMIHSDRLSRKSFDYYKIMDFFDSLKIKVIFVTLPGIDRDTAAGMLQEGMFAAVNEYHRNISSEKTKAALNEKIKEGWFPGKAPIGYKKRR